MSYCLVKLAQQSEDHLTVKDNYIFGDFAEFSFDFFVLNNL